MNVQLHSFPKFMRSEPSPRVQDSAFPPFKVEHRYRGVYERAGFDVLKGGAKGDSSQSSTPRTRAASTFSSGRSNKSVNSAISPTNPSQYFQPNNSAPSFERPNPYQQTQTAYSSRNKSMGELPAPSRRSPTASTSQPVQPHTAQGLYHLDRSKSHLELRSPRNYSGTTAVSSINEPVLLKQDTRLADTHSDFNFSPLTAQSKNFMNLSLNLNNDALEDHVEGPVDESETNNDTNETSLELAKKVSHTTSVQTDELLDSPEKRKKKASGLPTPPENVDRFSRPERLSAALDEFKNDVVNFGANTPLEDRFYQAKAPTIQVDNARMSYAENETTQYHDASQHFESFKEQNRQESQNLNHDYQNFLNGNLQVADNRKSQLSMVSSIISKESKYSDDGDSEVERELERQLQTLKNGGSTALFSKGSETHDQPEPAPEQVVQELAVPALYETEPSLHESEPSLHEKTAHYEAEPASFQRPELISYEHKQVPAILETEPEEGFYEVQSEPALYKTQPESDEEIEEDAFEDREVQNGLHIQPYPSHFPEESPSPAIPQITINNEEPAWKPEPTNVYPIHSPEIDEEGAFSFNAQDNESIESIKPLSVRHSKTKTRDFELPDISKTPKGQTYEVDDEVPLDRVDSSFVNNDLHEVRLSRKSVPDFKYPSGSGPCRTCNSKIMPNAKGSDKAIYSKTGELTGQWHRRCFRCAHEDCDVQFNKNVQCYVLDDEAYCNHHYHTLNHSLCENCQLGIEGECIENELDQKWHLHCLRCLKCRNAISNDYYLINDNIFCEADAINIINGSDRNGLTTTDKIEKRRTRLMHID